MEKKYLKSQGILSVRKSGNHAKFWCYPGYGVPSTYEILHSHCASMSTFQHPEC